jgi:hypothetical protein
MKLRFFPCPSGQAGLHFISLRMTMCIIGIAVGRGWVRGRAANPAPANSKHHKNFVIPNEERNLVTISRIIIKKILKI